MFAGEITGVPIKTPRDRFFIYFKLVFQKNLNQKSKSEINIVHNQILIGNYYRKITLKEKTN